MSASLPKPIFNPLRYAGILFLLLIIGNSGWGQSTANYTFTTGTTGSLATDLNGNAVDLSSSSTSLVSASSDDAQSSLTPFGFDFWFMGTRYTQFSASDNGIIGLGGQPGTAVYSIPNSSTPTIAPFANDLRVGTNGIVRSKLVGSAPNRCLVIEWSNVMIRYLNTAGSGTGTFQARLYESTGVIEFVYGAMTTNTASPASYYVGFSSSASSNKVISVNTTANTTSTSSTATANSYTASSTITQLNSSGNNSRRYYRFTPPVTSAPTNLTFSSISATSYTLNWSNAGSGRVGTAIYYSTDGGSTFTYYGITSTSTATSQSVTGLSAGTSYLWNLFSVSEGYISSALAGSQSTSAPTQYYYGGGNINTTSTWWTVANSSGLGVSGSHPTSISDAASVFNIQNSTTAPTMSASITLSSTSKIVVGGGTSSASLTISSTRSITGTIDVSSNGTLTITNTTIPTLGAVDENSTIIYNGSSAQTVAAKNYGNLTLSGTGTKTFAGQFDIAHDFNTTSSVTLNTSASLYTFNIGGDVTISAGTFNTGNTNPSTGTLNTTINVSGDFIKSSGTITNTSSIGIANLVFKNAGTHNFSNSGTFDYMPVFIQDNSTVTANSTLALTGISGTVLTVDAGSTLVMGDNLIAPNTTSTILINGTLKTTNALGFSGASGTTISSTGSPTVTLGSNSIIEYNGTTQAVTGRSDYANLTISGTDVKTLGSSATISGMCTISNGTLNVSGGTMTLGASGSMTINPVAIFKVTSPGTANFANRPVTIKSNSTGTGSIGASTGTISNAASVTVERYIPVNTTSGRTGKAWRLLTVPVTGSTIKNGWQEGSLWDGTAAITTASGYGTLITGLQQGNSGAANGNGFDFWSAVSNSTSSIRYHSGSGSGAWLTFSSINGRKFEDNAAGAYANQGFLLYVRGDRTVNTGTTNATVLRATGRLKQGSQSIPVLASGTSTYTLIGNPYASPINFESVYNGNASLIQPRFTIWDANLGTTGGYRLVTRTGANTYTVTPSGGITGSVAQYIQSGQAFFVEAVSGSGNLSIQESYKATSGTDGVLLKNSGNSDEASASATAAIPSISVNLSIRNTDGTVLLADGALVSFDKSYKRLVNGEDVKKASNFAENLAVAIDTFSLISERRPMLNRDTIFLKIWNTGVKDYRLTIKASAFAGLGKTVVLKDKYLGTTRTLKTDGTATLYDFNVTTDEASKASDRFYIIIRPSTVVAGLTNSIKIYPNPVKNGKFSLSLDSLTKGTYQLSIFDNSGQLLMTRTIEHGGGALNEYMVLSNQRNGIYNVRLSEASGAVVKTGQLIISK